MGNLIINATNETPEVNFNGENGLFKISGKSYPENVNNFYKPIFEYIEIYKQNPALKTTIEFNWLYYNTATNKMIMKVIMFLKDINSEFQVNWYYKKGFELIKDKGIEIKDVLPITIDIIELP
jgi:hypothetical protein